MKNYNDRIRELREDHDLTQTQVAAVLGIDQRTYSNYELGYRALPIDTNIFFKRLIIYRR